MKATELREALRGYSGEVVYRDGELFVPVGSVGGDGRLWTNWVRLGSVREHGGPLTVEGWADVPH